VSNHPAAALLSKRWDLLAAYKDQYWRERKQLGLREALRIVDSLRTQAQFFNPSWPTPEDREADLETHVRSPRRSRAPRRTKPSGRPQHRVPRASLDAIVAFATFAERENLRWYLFGAPGGLGHRGAAPDRHGVPEAEPVPQEHLRQHRVRW
jgi:hypothetical protein